jgi:glutamyl-tRNA reductase
MGIILVGANHRSAAVGVREQLAFTDEASTRALREWLRNGELQEALILSTCNRVELLAVSSDEPGAPDHLCRLLSDATSISPSELTKHTYRYTDEEAVQHLFRVAASLDSMVVGEPQILGQLRKAYALATEAGAIGSTFHKLLPHAFRVAKRVRNETDIAHSAVSVSYMAVELGRKIFASLAGRTVLVIGGGTTAELAARHLVKSGVGRVLFANRTHAKAGELAAKFGGQAVAMEQLGEHLAAADIVICSTSAPEFVITAQMVQVACARRQPTPIVFIDISVPRNIDPAIAKLENSFVFNIDDLKSLVLSNLDRRQRESKLAEGIVEQEVVRFREVLRSLRAGPAIGRLRQRMQLIAREEIARYRKQLGPLSREQEHALEELVLATVKKVSHPIITQMRSNALEFEL